MITPLVVLLALVSLVIPADRPSDKPAAPVRVYVFTATTAGREPSDEEKGRLDSLEDLREALSHRRSDFTIVARAEDAQVTIEVVNREERDTSQGGFGGMSVSRFRDTLLRLRVKAGDDVSELKGVGQGSWSSAAKDAAERLAKWVKNHGLKGADWQ